MNDKSFTRLHTTINNRVTETDLKALLKPFGRVERVYICIGIENYRSLGMASINFWPDSKMALEQVLSHKHYCDGGEVIFTVLKKKKQGADTISILLIPKLEKDIDLSILYETFNKYGEIDNILLQNKENSDNSVVFAFIAFKIQFAKAIISNILKIHISNPLKLGYSEIELVRIEQDAEEFKFLFTTDKPFTQFLYSPKNLSKEESQSQSSILQQEEALSSNLPNKLSYLEGSANKLIISIYGLPLRNQFTFRTNYKEGWLNKGKAYFRYLKFAYKYGFEIRGDEQILLLKGREAYQEKFNKLEDCEPQRVSRISQRTEELREFMNRIYMQDSHLTRKKSILV